MEKLPRFWTSEDLEKASAASTFGHLVGVALRIIDRSGASGMVCGPMTNGGRGSLEENYQEFRKAIAGLEKKGIVVFNQLPFEHHLSRVAENFLYHQSEDQLLSGFYLPLFVADNLETLYFLDGWQTSFGAVWEHKQAELLGKKIIYL